MHESTVLIVLVSLAVGWVFVRLGAVERRLDRLARLEGKIDALLAQAGVEFDPLKDVPDSVREALARGERILAIKCLRQATGLDLRGAKDIVDELRRRAPAGS